MPTQYHNTTTGVPTWKTAAASCFVVIALGTILGLLFARWEAARAYKIQLDEKRAWLQDVYKKHNPAKLADVDYILKCFENKLGLMTLNVRKKYDLDCYPDTTGILRNDPPPTLSDSEAASEDTDDEQEEQEQ
jgi:hypothetical protein